MLMDNLTSLRSAIEEIQACIVDARDRLGGLPLYGTDVEATAQIDAMLAALTAAFGVRDVETVDASRGLIFGARAKTVTHLDKLTALEEHLADLCREDDGDNHKHDEYDDDAFMGADS